MPPSPHAAPTFVTGSTLKHVISMTATGSIGLAAVFFVDVLNLFYIAQLGQKELAVLFQDASGELLPPEKVALSDEGAYGMEIVDADGDGRLDLLHLSSGSRDGVRVRLQTGVRQFGPEQALPLKPARSTLQLLERATGGAPAVFAQDRLTIAQLAALTGANRNTLTVRLRELVSAGRVRRHGKARATWYSLSLPPAAR